MRDMQESEDGQLRQRSIRGGAVKRAGSDEAVRILQADARASTGNETFCGVYTIAGRRASTDASLA